MTDANPAASGTASPADGGARPSAAASTKGNGARSRATASKPAQSPRKRGAATTAPKKVHATSSASTTTVDAEDSLTPKFEAELAKDAEATRKDLNSLDQNTFEIVHRVGGRLTKHKKRLGHGRWLRFLSECRLGEQSARNYMNVFKSFPNPKLVLDLPIDMSARYLLAAPSVSQEARDEAIKRAQAGETVTKALAKQIVAEHGKKRDREPKNRLPPSVAQLLAAAEDVGKQLRAFCTEEFKQGYIDDDKLAQVARIKLVDLVIEKVYGGNAALLLEQIASQQLSEAA